VRPATNDAYRLMHEGALALTQVERAGFRLDLEYMKRAETEVKETIAGLTSEIKNDPIWKRWQRKFGVEANLNSRHQLAKVLFDELGYEATGRTAGAGGDLEGAGGLGGRASVEITKLDKILRTYLIGFREEAEGDRLHPFFSLHRVLTYRGACSDPNLQNIPIRVEEVAKYIRQCFISSGPDYRLIELDFSGIEVRVAACYHKDPTMLRYIRDGYDMHRDMAIECYRLQPQKEWAAEADKKALKALRQQAKALFVFAQFYGDWYISCAQSLWEAVERYHLKGIGGCNLYAHLQDQGIERLGELDPNKEQPGTFVQHLKEVERRFWGERFPVYDRWRKDWFKTYERNGYFHTLTGFLIQGIYDRNFVINAPVQGSAFHVLLWCLTEMVKRLRKAKMRSKVVCQIHDSMIGDVHKDEEAEYMAMAKQLMTVEVFERFPWIITPIEAEAEASPYGGNWHQKKGIAF
jgi:DNA polymerase I-like protein with 3'-5' exonuclease and polymerase domains